MTTKKYKVGGIEHNAFDVDADDICLFIAVLTEDDLPKILRMNTSLLADAAVVLDKADGSSANVVAGNYSAYYVWASGDFGAADKVLLSTDRGNYWFAQNDWSDANKAIPLFVGPGNDLRVTVGVDTAFKQTVISGESVYWFTNTTVLPFTVNAIDRLDEDYSSCFIGCEYDPGYPRVEYSPNDGTNWSNITSSLPSVTVSALIAGYYEDDD